MNRRDLLRLTLPAAAVGAGILPTVSHAEVFKLTPRESEQFVADLLNPPGPNAAFVAAAERYKDWKISQVLAVLQSDEFRCIAHDNIEDRYAYNDQDWINRTHSSDYDSNGYCLRTLTARVEREYGELGGSLLSSSLVFDGPCATIHGYNDDSQNYYDLSERYSERKALLKQVMRLLYG